MDAIQVILNNIQAAAQGLVPALYTLLLAAVIDLATGLFAAWRSGTLQWAYVSEFVRGHLALKIAPIMGALVFGAAVGGVDSEAGLALVSIGIAGASAYLLSVIASIGLNLQAAKSRTKGLPSTVTPATVVPILASDSLEQAPEDAAPVERL